MPRPNQSELDFGLDPLRAKEANLTISTSPLKAQTPAQAEFNKRMKALEKARTAHERERERLDKELRFCSDVLMPLVEGINRASRDMIYAGEKVWRTTKLSARRHKWFGDLISGKIVDLLEDPVGLADDEIDRLEALAAEIGLSVIDEERKQMESEEFGEMREFMEEMARTMGVDLDLEGLDIHGDPAEFDRLMQERLAAAGEQFQRVAYGDAPLPEHGKRQRKPSKAALERERLKQEMEDAKTRDFKSLYKQLAKVLHPDLETDPTLKAHKEEWMKRLTSAYSNGDLRDMLAIEMEWLGEEAGNLAKASDEKLRVYAMVLKEQLDELKEKTRMLAHELQYETLLRFMGPFGDRLEPVPMKRELSEEISHLKAMTGALLAGGPAAKNMVNRLADAHARACGG